MFTRISSSARARGETLWRALRTPRLRPASGLRLTRLGSEYGGWDFVDRPELHGGAIMSAGLGEDASFDVELAAKYGAKVIIVDPTPRAIRHFRDVYARVGEPALTPYVSGGRQPPESYNMSSVAASQLMLVERALWSEQAKLSFYSPSNPEHVSHSVSNYQNGYAQTGEHIAVDATTVPAIMEAHGLTALPLIKLDIEGAEIEVLAGINQWPAMPIQILVEFDEIGFSPTGNARRRMVETHKKLLSLGYVVSAWDGRCNASYFRPQAS